MHFVIVMFCNALALFCQSANSIQIIFSMVWATAKIDQDKYHQFAIFCIVGGTHALIQLLFYIFYSFRNRSLLVMTHSPKHAQGFMIIIHVIPLIWGTVIYSWQVDNPIPLLVYVWTWIHAVCFTFICVCSIKHNNSLLGNDVYSRF